VDGSPYPTMPATRATVPTAYMPASRPRGPTAVPNRAATARDIPGRYPTARADASPTYPRGPTAQPSGNRRTGPPGDHRRPYRADRRTAGIPRNRARADHTGSRAIPARRYRLQPNRADANPTARTATRAQVCYNPRQQTPKPPSNTHSNPKTESNTCSIEQMFDPANVKT